MLKCMCCDVKKGQMFRWFSAWYIIRLGAVRSRKEENAVKVALCKIAAPLEDCCRKWQTFSDWLSQQVFQTLIEMPIHPKVGSHGLHTIFCSWSEIILYQPGLPPELHLLLPSILWQCWMLKCQRITVLSRTNEGHEMLLLFSSADKSKVMTC